MCYDIVKQRYAKKSEAIKATNKGVKSRNANHSSGH